MTQITPRERMRAAMRRQPTDRIPTMPQIKYDNAIHIYEQEYDGDWLDGLQRCVENPVLMNKYALRLVEDVNCDGLRLFPQPEPMKVKRVGDSLIVLDREKGDRIGSVDTMGGGYLVPDRPVPPVETLDEAKQRLDEILRVFTDEKVEGLRAARESVPDRFVASPPRPSITMNTYAALRGREQAMTDFYDRPGFVSAVLDMQAEAAIRTAERLLSTGIDAFYIGDPSASASLISPKHFERFCLPPYRKFCDHFKDTDILIYIHICGNSGPILEMMADTGAHVIEPLDPLGGVSVADAKRRIGDRVALMGGVNPLTLLNGTPEEVRAESIQKCREGGPQGYILASGDMVPPRTSLENLQALVDVATKSLWKE